MSTTSLSDYKKPFNRRYDSGELDVFEAARYFSGYNDNYAVVGSEKIVIKDERQRYLRPGRASLDMPSLGEHQHYYHQYQQNHPVVQQHYQQQQVKDKKKYKQPSSPGGKLAQFLNSLFSQTTSKKKKQSKPTSTQSMKDEDESPSGRRKRRSSISHFRSTSSAVDSKSLYTSSSSGFRTPPPYITNTPAKSYKEFRNFSDHDYKDVLATLSKYKNHENGNGIPKDVNTKGSEKLKVKDLLNEKSKNLTNSCQEKKRETSIYNEVDDGEESDSSSDLFELQIDNEFGFCSSELPVYETTHLDNIKRSSATAITNGPVKG